jgi:two-component sensor histidine kinase
LNRPSIIAPVLRIVIPYLILGAAWILFSDRLLLSFSDNPRAMIVLSTAKGWLYVLVTSLLLWLLVYRELRTQSILETKLREGLADKGALLAELNHRVKNNLQVIASILNLEAEDLEGEGSRALNDRTRTRIRAMGIAYERLFEGGEFARIDLGGYLRDLWEVMTQIYSMSKANGIFELETVVAGADVAVPFGLFATEALTNAILYGVGDSGTSEVLIGLRAPNPGTVEFTVRDRGPGLPIGAQGLGLNLMAALGAQLHGQVARANEGGAVICLRFDLSEIANG